jgi:3-dehydroquinate synthase
VAAAVKACGLPVWSEHLGERNRQGQLLILEGLAEFREHLGGALTITLPDGIGRKLEVHQMDPAIIEEGVEVLRSRQ